MKTSNFFMYIDSRHKKKNASFAGSPPGSKGINHQTSSQAPGSKAKKVRIICQSLL
jgi:hypothetical protein